MFIFEGAEGSIFEFSRVIDFSCDRSEILCLVHGTRSRLILFIHFKGPALATRYGIATILFEEVQVFHIILIWYVLGEVSITLLDALESTFSLNAIDRLALADCSCLGHVVVHAWAVLAQEIQLELREIRLLCLGCQRVARRRLLIRICDFT